MPLAALDTQNGLAAETEIPQVPTRLGSVTAAAPAVSAIRVTVWTKFVAANAGAVDESAAAKTLATQRWISSKNVQWTAKSSAGLRDEQSNLMALE